MVLKSWKNNKTALRIGKNDVVRGIANGLPQSAHFGEHATLSRNAKEHRTGAIASPMLFQANK
jgi:hypothetical protein